MICASCTATTDTTPCGACGADPHLDGRYRLDAVLGHGGGGVTYRATRLADGREVCVKELAYHRLQSFEAERLFAREAAILRQLDHPQIPAYLDDFTAGEGRHVGLYLVQELVVGRDLAAEMAARRTTEREVLALLDELLGVLAYLHGLAPPVVHRDLKPGNILRRVADGRLVLVDFGAVKDTVAGSLGGGASVAGTFGFMAPEQLHGQATPASDVYAVGVLAVVLLSRRDPADLVDEAQELAWRAHVRVSEGTERLIARCVRRNPAERPEDATAARVLVRAALAALDRGAAGAVGGPLTVTEAATADAGGDEVEGEPRWRPRPAGGVDEQASEAGDGAGESWSAATGGYPKPSARASAWVAAAMGLVGLGVLVLMLMPSRSSRQDEGPATVPVCAGAPCAPLSEPVLAGLRFGMSRAEAQAARRDLALGGVARQGDEDAAVIAEILPGYGGEVARETLTAKVLLAGEPVACVLDFADGEGLARLACEAEFGDHALGDAFAGRLELDLERRFGPATGHTETYGLGREPRWDGADGELRLKVQPPALPSASTRIALTQRVAAWERAEAAAAQRVEAQRASRAAARHAEERAAREAERARLEALERGSSPP